VLHKSSVSTNVAAAPNTVDTAKDETAAMMASNATATCSNASERKRLSIAEPGATAKLPWLTELISRRRAGLR
jgi:CHASE3 domain sensor protein